MLGHRLKFSMSDNYNIIMKHLVVSKLQPDDKKVILLLVGFMEFVLQLLAGIQKLHSFFIMVV